MIIISMTSVLMAQEGIPDEALGPIYMEALLFFGGFAILGLISYVISSKHAKKYAAEVAKKRREAPKVEEVVVPKVKNEQEEVGVDRLITLSKMLEDGLLTPEEFTTLKASLMKEL